MTQRSPAKNLKAVVLLLVLFSFVFINVDVVRATYVPFKVQDDAGNTVPGVNTIKFIGIEKLEKVEQDIDKCKFVDFFPFIHSGAGLAVDGPDVFIKEWFLSEDESNYFDDDILSSATGYPYKKIKVSRRSYKNTTGDVILDTFVVDLIGYSSVGHRNNNISPNYERIIDYVVALYSNAPGLDKNMIVQNDEFVFNNDRRYDFSQGASRNRPAIFFSQYLLAHGCFEEGQTVVSGPNDNTSGIFIDFSMTGDTSNNVTRYTRLGYINIDQDNATLNHLIKVKPDEAGTEPEKTYAVDTLLGQDATSFYIEGNSSGGGQSNVAVVDIADLIGSSTGNGGVDLSNGGLLNGTVLFGDNAGFEGDIDWSDAELIYDDGYQGNGYLLVSDENGTAHWADPATLGLGNGGSLDLCAGFDSTSFTPADSTIGVDVEQNIEIQFNKLVASNTGRIIVKAGASTFLNYEISDPNITISGNKVIIDPIGNFADNTQYCVTADPGVIACGLDASTTWNGVTGSSQWCFNTGAELQIASQSPADNAIDILRETDLTIEFANSFVFGTGMVQVFRASDDTPVSPRIDVSTLSVLGNEVTIDLPTDLAYGTEYYVYVNGGAFIHASDPGIVNEAIGVDPDTNSGSNEDWNFFTRDALTCTPQVPSDNGTDISITPSFSMQCNYNVNKFNSSGSHFIQIREAPGPAGALVANLDVSTMSVPGTSQTVNINFGPLTLDYYTDYYLSISNGSFIDAGDPGNTYKGLDINNDTGWNFRTRQIDNCAYQFATAVPSDNSNTVDIATNFSIQANVQVEKNTGNGKVIEFRDFATHAPEFSVNIDDPEVTLSSDNRTIMIDPIPNLSLSNDYYIYIEDGAFRNVINPANLCPEQATRSNWNFETVGACHENSSNPRDPDDGAIGVNPGTNLTIRFNTNISAGSGGNRLRIYKVGVGTPIEEFAPTDPEVSFGASSITVNPSSDLDFASDYYVTIDSGFVENSLESTDDCGADFSSTTEWNFRTEEFIDLVSSNPFDPANAASGVNIGTNIRFSFDKNIQIGSNKFITINNITDGGSIRISTANVNGSVSGNSTSILTINPAEDLLYERTYDIELETGVVEQFGEAADIYQGLSAGTYQFTTQITPTPSVTNRVPAHNSGGDLNGINRNTNIEIEFDLGIALAPDGNPGQAQFELWEKGFGLVESFDLINGSNILDSRVNLVNNSSAIDNGKIIIDPSVILNYETEYYVVIQAGTVVNALKPVQAINLSSFTGDGNWNFSTLDALECNVTNPSDLFNVSLTGAIIITCNKDISLNGSDVVVNDVTGSSFEFNRFPLDTSDSHVNMPSSKSVRIDPGSLSYSRSYDLIIPIGGVANSTDPGDNYGNSSPVTINFQTESDTPPAHISFNPTGIDVPTDTKLTINFNKAVNLDAGGSITIANVNNGNFETISSDISDPNLVFTDSPSNQNLEITLSSNLDTLTTYYVNISNDAIYSAVDNTVYYGGILDTSTWSFRTAPAPPLPTITENITMTGGNGISSRTYPNPLPVGGNTVGYSYVEVINTSPVLDPAMRINLDASGLPISVDYYLSGLGSGITSTYDINEGAGEATTLGTKVDPSSTSLPSFYIDSGTNKVTLIVQPTIADYGPGYFATIRLVQL